MLDPNLSLAGFAVLTVYYLGDCAWRLWRRKATKYLSVGGEVILAFAVVFGMMTVLKANDALHSAAKVFVIGAFLAATILRLIARQRFVET